MLALKGSLKDFVHDRFICVFIYLFAIRVKSPEKAQLQVTICGQVLSLF